MTDRAQERSLPVEGELAEETESSTTEVINLDDSTEATPEQTASSSQGTKVLMPAVTAPPDTRGLPMAWEAVTSQQQVGTKRPAPALMLTKLRTKENPSKAQELQRTLITRLRVVTRVAALLCL